MPLNSSGYLENIFSPIIYSYKATQGSQLAIWEDRGTENSASVTVLLQGPAEFQTGFSHYLGF